MKSIRRNLTTLVLLAVIPALAILLYSGIEQRQASIEDAKKNLLLLTHTMATSQHNIANVTRQTLATLALLPQVRSLDLPACSQIFKDVVKENPGYFNLSLVNLNGDIIASSRPLAATNLADRKHFREALERKEFVAGEYIVTRIGPAISALPFAYPVLDERGNPAAIIATAIDLSYLGHLYQPTVSAERSFLSATDHRGLRLYYYPFKEKTNPVGQPIMSSAWENARQAQGPGTFFDSGSDGEQRVVAFEPVRLSPDHAPYMYMWAGIPEAAIYGPANAKLARNLLLMLGASALALLISWAMGRRTIVAPINQLIGLTQQFSGGNLEFRSELPDKHNEFWTLTEAFHDMAANLKLIQTALEMNAEKTRQILNTAAEAIFGLDAAGNCTFCNPSCLELLGYPAEEALLGRNMHELLHHTAVDGTPIPIEHCEIHRALREGNNVYNDNTMFWKTDGTSFPAEYWARFIARDNEIVGAVVSFIDISARKKAAEEREHIIVLLQDKTAEQERFVYTISHDLKSPVVTIKGFLGMLDSDLRAGDENAIAKDLEYIQLAADRIDTLLDDLLELSRVGNMKSAPEESSFQKLAHEAVVMVAGAIAARQVEVVIADADVRLFGDYNRLLEIWQNLTENAVKYLGPQSSPRVDLGVDQQGDEVVFSVGDNGLGIDPQYHEKIFGMFEKIDPATEGSGLGLALVKRIVELNKGRIWVESAGAGKGSCFYFTLPATVMKADA